MGEVDHLTNTSLNITWTLVDEITATNYSISYSNINNNCFDGSKTVSGIASSQTMYTLTGLEEGTEYSITVTASLTGGVSIKENITANTKDAGLSTQYHF